jgi:hypothetical protein
MAEKGFLLVMMQCPPMLEEEFNAWYDTEHLPERLSVPGVETALRFVCLDGHPHYLAMYDLEKHEVLETPAYMKVAYDQSSPWTKRATSRVRVTRTSGNQIYPGNVITKRPARVTLVRYRGLNKEAGREIVAAVRRAFEDRPETTQVRVLAHDTGAGGIDYMAFVEAKAPFSDKIDVKSLGPHAGAIDLVNTYAPYAT